MTSATRTIKSKPMKVTDPSGKVHLVYAQTKLGAIRAVKEATKTKEVWSADDATAEDLYIAAKQNINIINAPASISPQPEQGDAFVATE